MLVSLLLRAATMPSTTLAATMRARCVASTRSFRLVVAALPERRERITLGGELLFSSSTSPTSGNRSTSSTSTSSSSSSSSSSVARPELQHQRSPIPSRTTLPPKIAVVGGDPKKVASVVPQARPATDREIDELAELIASSETVTVLTGSGISTESGIPDYRSPGSGAYATGFKPMTVQQFLSGPTARARYWTRSFFGWGTFSTCRPAASHESIARLQRLGWVANNVENSESENGSGSVGSENGGGGGGTQSDFSSFRSAAVGEHGAIITQNVDRLHQAAGSRGVLELHGTTHVVRCLNADCGHRIPRSEFQGMLAALNPEAAAAAARADAAAAAAASVPTSVRERKANAKPAEPGGLYRRDATDDGGGAGRPRGAPDAAAVVVGGCGAVAAAADDPAVLPLPSSATARGDDNDNDNQRKNPLLKAHEGAEGAPISVPFRRPDGDVEVADAGEGAFLVPDCPRCGTGNLMPDVVFFGDSLPKKRAEAAKNRAAASDLLLVVGTSVQVFSAFRLVQSCADNGGRIAIVNAGPTRADALDAVVMKLPCLAGETFARLARHPSLASPRPVGEAASARTRPR